MGGVAFGEIACEIDVDFTDGVAVEDEGDGGCGPGCGVGFWWYAPCEPP